MKNQVLDHIRKNLSLDRVLEVEKILKELWYVKMSLYDLKQYLSSVLMEGVYQAHKGSYKIDASKI